MNTLNKFHFLLNEKNNALAQIAELESERIEHLEEMNEIKSNFSKAEELFKQN